MTNTTANPEAKKKKKAKGPIRTEAIVPSVIIIALVYGYFYFFFDTHLRKLMEFSATQMYGAEVNIEKIETSFWGASFRMKGLQATDASQPSRNLFEVGEVRFEMLMDALLRAKAVVRDASILDVKAYTPRKSPGKVLPPPKPGSGILAKAEAQMKDQIRQKLNQNFLGDIVEVLSGVDPKQQLATIKADLKAVARAESLENELKAKKTEWEKRIKELPRPKDVKDLEAQVKALNFKSRNPLEIAQNVKKAKEIIGEAQAKVKLVDQGQRDLTNDINTYTAAIKSLEQMAEADVADLQKRLKLPSIDAKEFSTQLFLSQLESKLVSVRKYVEIARKYMPPKKTPEQIAAEKNEKLVPPPRGAGRTYTFPITTGYPLFWLKHAALSSEITQSEWAGKVKGELKDFSTEPSQIGLPFRATLNGDFPKQNIRGLEIAATVDHTTEKSKESLRMEVASYPLGQMLLSNSEKVRFGLKQAAAATKLEATLADQALTLAINASFREPQFLVETQNAKVQEILSNVLQGIPLVTFAANASGSFDKFGFNVDSNLGQSLSAGFKKELDAKLGDAKTQLRAQVEAKLAGPRKQVQEQLNALLAGPAKLLGQNRSEMDQAIKGAEGSAQPAGGGAKGLLKGFGL